MHGCGCGSAQLLAVLPGMSQSGAHALPQYLSFELGEHCQ
jgi:undecaprenyl pyrophosphate phosphatase UppP